MEIARLDVQSGQCQIPLFTLYSELVMTSRLIILMLLVQVSYFYAMCRTMTEISDAKFYIGGLWTKELAMRGQMGI